MWAPLTRERLAPARLCIWAGAAADTTQGAAASPCSCGRIVLGLHMHGLHALGLASQAALSCRC